MSRRRCPLFRFLLFLLLLFLSLGVSAQQPPDDEAVWRSFLTWFKMAAVDANPIDGHLASTQSQV
jgi:hypothetical protein